MPVYERPERKSIAQGEKVSQILVSESKPLIHLVHPDGGSAEMARPGHFANAYIGKEYTDGYTEVLSMGMESLFAGRMVA